MSRSLSLKLVLAFITVSLVGTALVAFFAVWTTARQFNQFVADQDRDSIVGQFAEYYRNNGGWVGVNEAYPLLIRQGFLGRSPAASGAFPVGRGFLALADDQGMVIVGAQGYQVGNQVSLEERQEGVPIEVGGETVGWLLQDPNPFERRLVEAEANFLSRVNRGLIIGALAATGVAVILGVLLARTLTRTLRELTVATRAVAQGDLDQQVPIRSKDELGELAVSFNQMNADLAHSRDLRRQMTADIAHDLRTPLSVILGHSEALNEGVLPPSDETFYIIHDEAQRLSRLVDDLRTLSLAEAGELQLNRRRVSLQSMLARAVTAHTPQAEGKNITLDLVAAPDVPEAYADPDRMAQVLDNLLSNALRHTPEGGHIELSAISTPDGVQVIVQDSGPGIPVDELPYIFERFYRGDKSRQRLVTHDKARQRQDSETINGSGSGLGLAIARSIVEAHEGRIWAESQTGSGVTFIVEFASG